MSAQFWQAPLASPPATVLGTGAALAPQCALGGCAKPLFGRRLGSVPVLRWASVPLRDGGRRRWCRVIFRRCSGPPPGDLGCRKWRPLPGGTGQGAINVGKNGDLRRYRLNKTGPEGPNKVGRAGACGFTRARAPPGIVHTASMVPIGGS